MTDARDITAMHTAVDLLELIASGEPPADAVFPAVDPTRLIVALAAAWLNLVQIVGIDPQILLEQMRSVIPAESDLPSERS